MTDGMFMMQQWCVGNLATSIRVCACLWPVEPNNPDCYHLNSSVHADAVALSNAYYGKGTGPIYLDAVQCIGDEGYLLSCPSRPIGSNNCVHSQDAGVNCSSK